MDEKFVSGESLTEEKKPAYESPKVVGLNDAPEGKGIGCIGGSSNIS